MGERAIYLRVDQVRRLDHWCANLKSAFMGAGVYLVGSVQEHADWRDVDVRVVLPDDVLVSLPIRARDLNYMLSRWGREQTDLPIDCQVQSVAEHEQHEQHAGKPANPRPHND